VSRGAGQPPYARGQIVVDEEHGRVGEVADATTESLQLRPLRRGGREWGADPARVRTATDAERLRATLAAVNATSREGRG
jgi:hypothetical protein